MSHVESDFTEAHDWCSGTGQGALEHCGQATHEDVVCQQFPCHFDPLWAMGHHGKACPKVTTGTLQQTLDEDCDVSMQSKEDEAMDGPYSGASAAPLSISKARRKGDSSVTGGSAAS